MNAPAAPTDGRVLGRYALFDEIASGGMATVHLGRLVGPVGFSRMVAIKRLHPQFAKDEDFVAMFLDEARLAGRIRHHPNVVTMLDVVSMPGELFLVMEYVDGETLSALLRLLSRDEQKMPVHIATSIVAGALYGLHAAHEATSEQGEPLGIVHRDVSPQNIMVGRDGGVRVLDFGVAKAATRAQSTRGGQLKGKLSYMSPEQLQGECDRRTDVYAAAVVLWEALTGRRLYQGENDAHLLMSVMRGGHAPPSQFAPSVPPEVDALVMRGLSVDPAARFATAHEMAVALETAVRPATAREIGEFVATVAGDRLAKRAARVAEIESLSGVSVLDDVELVDDDFLSEPSGVATEVSGTGMTATSPTHMPSPPPKRRGRLLLVVGGAAAALLLLLFWTLRSDGPPPAAVAIAPSAAAPPMAAASSAHDVVADTTADAEAPPAATSTVKAVDPSTLPLVPVASASVVRPVKPSPSKTPAAGRAKSSCNPPYVIDGNGIKHYKPECL